MAGVADPRLLDCGCGTGSNLALLREFGRAFGFDFTARVCARPSRPVDAVARASVAAIPFADASFDVVTSFDVFQCVPAEVERAGVAEFHRVLKPGGRLIVNVAALEVLSGGHAVLSDEYRRYTTAALRDLLEGAGLIVERLTFVHATLFPLMLPVRVVQRWRGGGAPGEFDITVPPAPVNALLTGLLGLEAAALRVVDMPIGSSLMCHARKPA